ncbi:MAG: hypothetical protein JW892_15200 [Anaerolineae bacterium]|nr:hypothetical protein [Anaerolineae bacterium]
MTLRFGVGICLLAWLLSGCSMISATPSPTATVTPALPQLDLPGAPETLCREATQLRLAPLLRGSWDLNGSATWRLAAAESGTPLATGEWLPLQRDLLIPFPDGQPLPDGKYRVVLETGTQTLLTHTFTILADSPELFDLQLALSPVGPVVTRIPDASRVFYIQFRYAGVCPGAPLWLSVSDDTGVICTHSLTLPEMAGDALAVCHRADGGSFVAGQYHATLTLASGFWALDFKVGEDPTPPPSPITYATHCDPLFVAAALDPQYQPLLPNDRFQWYTQAVYVGATCHDLPPAVPWLVRWYRQGALVHESEGLWDGGLTGVVWDSYAGSPEVPFLRSGTYSATLAISGTVSLTTTFRIIPYTPPAP